MSCYSAAPAQRQSQVSPPPPPASSRWLDWNRFLLFVSYVKLAISIMKYLPQVFLNWRRKSTVGWNIYNVFLDFTGGALSVGQLVMDCEVSGDWSQLKGDPVKFFLGNISMFFDIIFFCQVGGRLGRRREDLVSSLPLSVFTCCCRPDHRLQHYCLYSKVSGDDSGDPAPAHFLTTGDEYARLVVDTISGDAAPAAAGTISSSTGKRDLARYKYDFTGY